MKPPILTSIATISRRARSQGKRVVLATGVFDLLHTEHLNFLHQAKAVGDLLLIGVESDHRVKLLKGPDRPYNPALIRIINLRTAHITPHIFTLPESFTTVSDHERLISKLRPHTLAVSSHSSHLESKNHILERYGGRVQIVYQHNPNISSTDLLAKAVITPTFTSSIIPGKGRGAKIGFPTLNLTIPHNFPYPHGIYAGWVIKSPHRYPTAFHYGPIPTFNHPESSLEAHVLDHHFSPIPTSISFQFISFIRDIATFTNPTALARKIKSDVTTTRHRLPPQS